MCYCARSTPTQVVQLVAHAARLLGQDRRRSVLSRRLSAPGGWEGDGSAPDEVSDTSGLELGGILGTGSARQQPPTRDRTAGQLASSTQEQRHWRSKGASGLTDVGEPGGLPRSGADPRPLLADVGGFDATSSAVTPTTGCNPVQERHWPSDVEGVIATLAAPPPPARAAHSSVRLDEDARGRPAAQYRPQSLVADNNGSEGAESTTGGAGGGPAMAAASWANDAVLCGHGVLVREGVPLHVRVAYLLLSPVDELLQVSVAAAKK